MSDYGDQKQVRWATVKRATMCLVLALMCGGLMACGKKASRLDPPSGIEDDNFPRVYPDPSLDAKPTYNPHN